MTMYNIFFDDSATETHNYGRGAAPIRSSGRKLLFRSNVPEAELERTLRDITGKGHYEYGTFLTKLCCLCGGDDQTEWGMDLHKV